MFILKRHEISLHLRAYSSISVKIPNCGLFTLMFKCGPVSVVGIELATGWTVRGSNYGGGKIFRTCPDWPWGQPSLLYNGYRVVPGGKERPWCDADPSPPSSAVVMKEQSYTSTPPMGRTVCTEPQCLYKGAIYLNLTQRRK
jgi:hypothetical protein